MIKKFFYILIFAWMCVLCAHAISIDLLEGNPNAWELQRRMACIANGRCTHLTLSEQPLLGERSEGMEASFLREFALGSTSNVTLDAAMNSLLATYQLTGNDLFKRSVDLIGDPVYGVLTQDLLKQLQDILPHATGLEHVSLGSLKFPGAYCSLLDELKKNSNLKSLRNDIIEGQIEPSGCPEAKLWRGFNQLEALTFVFWPNSRMPYDGNRTFYWNPADLRSLLRLQSLKSFKVQGPNRRFLKKTEHFHSELLPAFLRCDNYQGSFVFTEGVLKNSTSLEALELHRSSIEGPFLEFPNLKTLKINRLLSHSREHVESLTAQEQFLEFRRTFLNSCPNLESASFYLGQLPPPFVSDSGIKDLDISGSFIDDALIDNIISLKYLKSLVWQNTLNASLKASPSLRIKKLLKASPSLTALDLRSHYADRIYIDLYSLSEVCSLNETVSPSLQNLKLSLLCTEDTCTSLDIQKINTSVKILSRCFPSLTQLSVRFLLIDKGFIYRVVDIDWERSPIGFVPVRSVNPHLSEGL